MREQSAEPRPSYEAVDDIADTAAKVPMLSRFLRDQSGAMLAEYALLLAIGLAGAGCVAIMFGRTISRAVTEIADLILLGL
jgi:Flp pilus assembly pilin Flp